MRLSLPFVALALLVPSFASAAGERPERSRFSFESILGGGGPGGAPHASPFRGGRGGGGGSFGGGWSGGGGGAFGGGRRFEESRRVGARRFLAIAAGTHDRADEVVVARGTLTTPGAGTWVAFLAQGDSRSPLAQRRLRRTLNNENGADLARSTVGSLMGDHGFEGSTTPWGQRAHLLVTPSLPHEHVAAAFGGTPTRSDLALRDELKQIGAQLARTFGIAGADVWQNSEAAVSVAQEHIHVTGRYTPSSRVPDLEPPAGGRRGRLLTLDRGRVVPMGDDGLPARP